MTRSLKKGPYVDEKLLKKIAGKKPMETGVVKTWARRSQISPEMIGFILLCQNFLAKNYYFIISHKSQHYKQSILFNSVKFNMPLNKIFMISVSIETLKLCLSFIHFND